MDSNEFNGAPIPVVDVSDSDNSDQDHDDDVQQPGNNVWDNLAEDLFVAQQPPQLAGNPPPPLPPAVNPDNPLNILIEENVLANPQDIIDEEEEEYYDVVSCSLPKFSLNILTEIY